jgi:hypothetical protein
MASSQGSPTQHLFLAIHSADEHRVIYSFSNTTSYYTFYAFFSSFPVTLTPSLLMLYICGVSKTFGEWYQKTNKPEDTNKLTLLVFKIIAILHNTRLATFIKLLETVSGGNPTTCDSCSAIDS